MQRPFTNAAFIVGSYDIGAAKPNKPAVIIFKTKIHNISDTCDLTDFEFEQLEYHVYVQEKKRMLPLKNKI